MLNIKHVPHIELPHLDLGAHQMELSPVPVDDDELTQAILDDPVAHDDVWELGERPDTNELTQFWTNVEADVATDPEWFKFSE